MCLTGGNPGYEYKEPKREPWESKYEGPVPDQVNNKTLGEAGSFGQEDTKHLAPKKAKLKPVKQSEKIVS